MDPQGQPNYPNQQPNQGGQAYPNQPAPGPVAPQPQQAMTPQQPMPQPQAMPPQQPMPQGQPMQPGQQPPQGPPQQGQGPTGPPQQGPPQAPKTNPNSTQNSLLIAEIRDGIVIMNDGSFRSVIMTKSINFDLMSPEERESVEFAYQNFLNSLYFPVQIFIRSKKVDMRPYLEKLDKMRAAQDNMLLALLMEDYINFIDILAQETNIMDKQFYVSIPYYSSPDAQKAVDQSKKFLTSFLKPKEPHTVVQINEADLEKAKQELKNRVQSVMSGLQQIGVQSIPLDTEELIELYYDSYNPDTATRQQIRNYTDLTAPVITKGTGAKPEIDIAGTGVNG